MADQGTSIRNSFCLFPTAIGSCAIAWSDRGVTSVWLPEQTDSHTRARVVRRFPHTIESAPPPFVSHAIDGIVALLEGEARNLTDIPLDWDDAVPEFHRRVYDVTRTIKPGTTLSYGEVAKRVGEPDAARAVGQALGRNPIPIIVPCHRVLAADGGTGGLGLDRANWAAGVQVVFPNLFDFSVLRSRRAAAGALTRAESARYDEAILNVTSQQRAADVMVDAARAVAQNTPVQLTAAQQSEAQARARYDAGLAGIVEVAEAQNLLAGAEYQDAAARVDVWRALLAKAVAEGNLASFIELLRASGVQ